MSVPTIPIRNEGSITLFQHLGSCTQQKKTKTGANPLPKKICMSQDEFCSRVRNTNKKHLHPRCSLDTVWGWPLVVVQLHHKDLMCVLCVCVCVCVKALLLYGLLLFHQLPVCWGPKIEKSNHQHTTHTTHTHTHTQHTHNTHTHTHTHATHTTHTDIHNNRGRQHTHTHTHTHNTPTHTHTHTTCVCVRVCTYATHTHTTHTQHTQQQQQGAVLWYSCRWLVVQCPSDHCGARGKRYHMLCGRQQAVSVEHLGHRPALSPLHGLLPDRGPLVPATLLL